MHNALWVVQGIVALAFTMAGALKLFTPRLKLAEKMHWAKTWTDTNVKLLGLAEVLGAVGMIVPGLTGILPILTPIAGIALAILMVGAVKTHLDLKESALPAAIPGALALVVTVGRFMYPLG
jgi:uncharacterized membrane protein